MYESFVLLCKKIQPLQASIRLCSSRCIARDTIDQQLTVLTGKYFQCSERKISFFAFKNEASNEIADRMLQFYKIYNFNISVKNSAGNWSIDGITLCKYKYSKMLTC